MDFKELDFSPERQWILTFTGFVIGYVIGYPITNSNLAALVYAAFFSIIGWGFSFYDENFTGALSMSNKQKDAE